LPDDLCRRLLEDFLESSWPSLEVLVEQMKSFKEKVGKQRKPISMFRFKNGQKVTKNFAGDNFFLRGSLEYSNPQLTLEEVQGIIGARFLES
jgi:hypothetical protein